MASDSLVMGLIVVEWRVQPYANWSCPGPQAAPRDLVPGPAHGMGIGKCRQVIGNTQQAIIYEEIANKGYTQKP